MVRWMTGKIIKMVDEGRKKKQMRHEYDRLRNQILNKGKEATDIWLNKKYLEVSLSVCHNFTELLKHDLLASFIDLFINSTN